MMYLPTEIAELVCTRMSHDLIGNIGALSNGMELLDNEDEPIDQETKAILNTAINTLKYRQKFFRLAFGIASYQYKEEEIYGICRDYVSTLGSKNYPLSIRLQNALPEMAKYFCLCIMIGAEVCVRGGMIEVSSNKSNLTIKVASEYELSAPKIEEYQQIIYGKKLQENASQYAHIIYLQSLLGKNIPINIQSTDKSMTMIIG